MKINLSSFLQWPFNIFMCRLLGWKFTLYYITFLGKLYFFFNRKEKSRIIKAVQTVFNDLKPPADIRAINQNVFRGIFSHYYEKFFNAFARSETLRALIGTHMQCEGMAAIQEGLAKGKGVLLITGHFGGVELIPAFLGDNNFPATIVAKFSSDRLRQVSLQQAEKFAVKIIDAESTPNIMKAVFDDLKANRIVITQCDEIDAWKPCRNNQIYFLGKPVRLDRTINIMTRRCGCAVVFGVMHRDRRLRYTFIATPWEEMAQRFQRSVDMSVGEVVLKFMEQYIYNFPEEWYQWKKYPVLDMFTPAGIEIEAPTAAPILEPSFR